MSNNEIIKKLKENERPFGLMDDDMRKCATQIGEDPADMTKFQWWNPNAGWRDNTEVNFLEGHAYRLRPDYAEEPEVVECRVEEHNEQIKFGPRNGGWVRLHKAVTDPDFIGFKYEDERLEQSSRVSHCGRAFLHKSGFTGEDIKFSRLDEYEVLTPIAVLFRKATP
jgi:hypothetical protein